MKTIFKLFVATIVAFFFAGVALLCDASSSFVIAVYFTTAFVLSTIFGVFGSNRTLNIHGKAQNMRKAA